MKTNFKKIASSAAVTAALATGSMSAHAIITDVPGEAYLVPFVVGTVGDEHGPFGNVDTVVRIVVPNSIGRDTVFDYTAPHTSPTNPLAGGGNTVLPEVAALKGGNHIHWTFLNYKSEHIIDSSFEITAEDVAIFDWQEVVRQNRDLLNNVAGYLVFQTSAGWEGQDADFSFFADAYFVTDAVGRDDDTGDLNDYFGSVNIPALPLADGADAGQTFPSAGNNVIVDGGTFGVDASPLISGIRTSSPGATNEITIVDLEVASQATRNDAATLMVVWNDVNASTWGTTGYQAFDTNENPCSSTLSLPHELNLIWSVARRGSYNPSDMDQRRYDMPTPDFVNRSNGGQTVSLCNPNTSGVSSFTEDRLRGGFVKLRLNEQDNVRQHSAVAFSINFGSISRHGIDASSGQHHDIDGFASETVLGHDRGKFNRGQ